MWVLWYTNANTTPASKGEGATVAVGRFCKGMRPYHPASADASRTTLLGQSMLYRYSPSRTKLLTKVEELSSQLCSVGGVTRKHPLQDGQLQRLTACTCSARGFSLVRAGFCVICGGCMKYFVRPIHVSLSPRRLKGSSWQTHSA